MWIWEGGVPEWGNVSQVFVYVALLRMKWSTKRKKKLSTNKIMNKQMESFSRPDKNFRWQKKLKYNK